MSSSSDRFSNRNSEQVPERRPFKRQVPIEEFDDIDEAEEPVSPSRISAKREGQQVRFDPDGTEYEWDVKVRGWFPKVSDDYLVEHNLNYGLHDKKFKFNADKNCYTYELEDGSLLRLDTTTNQWIPFEATIERDNGIPSFLHPLLKIRFTRYPSILRNGRFEPTDVATYTDTTMGVKYIWSREHNGFVDEKMLTHYVDVVSGVAYRRVGSEWLVDEAVEMTHEDQQSSTVELKSHAEEERINQIGWLHVPDEKNRNVYVSNIPDDMTDSEFVELMSKYGMIAVDIETRGNRPRIKLYKDELGKNKGDGLCTFAKVESVDLCLKLLDGSIVGDKVISAQRAKFEQKGTFDPAKKRKRCKKDSKSKMNHRLFGWDGDMDAKPSRPKTDRILVVRNIIDDSNPFMTFPEMSAIKTSVRELFKSYAPVKDVRIFPATGTITVGFNSPDEADKCKEYVNGRLWTSGRTIECITWDGKTKFDAPPSDENVSESTPTRIQKWHELLESSDHCDDTQSESN